ncbi:MAG: FliA/WhiG family RNA polymerase sigma factor [Planctomycetota bacterium]
MRKIRDANYRHLWNAYAETQSPDVKSQLIEAYFPLVKYLAERMVTTLPASVEVDDLISMGTFGLIEAIDRFDLSRGIQFKTYCTARIRGAILDSLRTNDWVPRLVRLRTNLVDKTMRRLYGELGREPTDPEMAEALDVSMPEYDKLRKEAKPTAMLSLTDDSSDTDSEGGGRMLDLVRDRRAADPHFMQQGRMVKDVLFRSLNEKERIVMQHYYYDGLSMREIAGLLRLTESRVCQIHSKVIRRLRELLQSRKAELFV